MRADLIDIIEADLGCWDTLRVASPFADIVSEAWNDAVSEIEKHHAEIEEARSKMPLEIFMERNDAHPQVIRRLAEKIFATVQKLPPSQVAKVERYVDKIAYNNSDPFEEAEAERVCR